MRNTWEAVEALTLISGHVEEEILIRNEYYATENKILNQNSKSLCNSVIVNEYNWPR